MSGVGCLAGAPAIVAGTAVIAHGGATAASGAVGAGQQLGNLYNSIMGEGSSSGSTINRGDLPDDVGKALSEIESGASRPNVRNPKPFTNDGRGSTPQLPSFDADGNAISYMEHTVNPRPSFGKLDGKRIVTGSDGSTYYTPDHFVTWLQVE